jgi:beta-glucosidase
MSNCLPVVCSLRYEEDASLAASLGCNGFRLSLEWSRIEPRRGYIDQAAVQR